jgi:hypothetical protein
MIDALLSPTSPLETSRNAEQSNLVLFFYFLLSHIAPYLATASIHGPNEQGAHIFVL